MKHIIGKSSHLTHPAANPGFSAMLKETSVFFKFVISKSPMSPALFVSRNDSTFSFVNVEREGGIFPGRNLLPVRESRVSLTLV